MSTRCHILIEGFEPMLYRHCDGYPGKADGSAYGVLADLIPFLAQFKQHRGWDESYLLARMAQHLCNAFTRDAEQLAAYGPDLLGVGIDLTLHGDEEFVYLLKKDWTVEVRSTTRAFWNEPTLVNTDLVESVEV